MQNPQLDVEAALPVWNRLNNVVLINVTPRHVPQRGAGLVAERDLTHDNTGLSPALARIPRDLVLSHQSVEEFTKVDGHFRELLDAAGRKSARIDACLFLLAQWVLGTHSRPPPGSETSTGPVHTPWAEYTRFLPGHVPVPTMWSDAERQLLRGTSLEAALTAKIETLTDEFDRLRTASSDLPFWNALFWDDNRVTRADWFLVDTWYRSRSLELPYLGVCMVPVLDLANHSSAPNAYYDEDCDEQSAGVKLLLRPGVSISAGEEVTISYGEGKAGAEMLFSYGFFDPTRSTNYVTLPLMPLEDDPLGMAKVHVFDGPRTVQLGRTTGSHSEVTWESPFAWLLCLNEEDGLAFRILQDTGGNRELRVLWQDEDVTGRIEALEELASSHPLYDVFKLRVVTVLEERVSAQLERVQTDFFPPDDENLTEASRVEREGIRAECLEAANALRGQEASVLEAAVRTLEKQKSQLLAAKTVVAYLGSMEVSQSEQAGDTASNQSDDFS
ncbi:SET domain-containing protein [Sodiomyces alkalinus F11]|uniref:SET domain-containing protein n=1 Tax=Sodiomyces alkalinus (strain CBS 110278 / VKM F-3762 / F11) TaxID=1314773 RepID=A0A3N2PM68_SODAK|nr:SET domain-containing protein [Sodiomyces alkalinus F11]ROT35504.1 SET domain-containing protein [Sodiomyces alkalinus F11]